MIDVVLELEDYCKFLSLRFWGIHLWPYVLVSFLGALVRREGWRCLENVGFAFIVIIFCLFLT